MKKKKNQDTARDTLASKRDASGKCSEKLAFCHSSQKAILKSEKEKLLKLIGNRSIS